MRGDGEKKVVDDVCGDVLLVISFIRNITLVDFVELPRRYAKVTRKGENFTDVGKNGLVKEADLWRFLEFCV